jgi:hypothetical protein
MVGKLIRGSKLVLGALGAIALAAQAYAAPIFLDFGDSAQPTPGNYNNLIVNPPPTLSIPNLIDSTGAATGFGANVSGFFNGSNTQGTTAPTGAASAFHAQATRDNGFGHAAAFGGNPLTPMGTVALTGLNPALTYDFTFFASRTGATDIRETEYAVAGLNSGSALLDASNNTSNVATVLSIAPTALGEITIQIDPGPNNNNASQFWYIAAMQFSATVPEPTCAAVLAAAPLLMRRRRGSRA